MRHERSDIEAVLRILSDLDALPAGEAYGPDVLVALQSLVPCDESSYQEADVDARRFLNALPGETEEDVQLYWSTGPCPITDYRVRTGDVSAVRMSDVIGRSRYHELPIYREYFQPAGLDHVLDLGLSAVPSSYRSVVLLRGHDVVDFSERERSLLEMLRPHLRAREARAALIALVAEPRLDAEQHPADESSRLTAREREIVAMAAVGKTNAQIAAELWVSPATVKKHLENVYLKLGVGSRTAAASRVQSHSYAT